MTLELIVKAILPNNFAYSEPRISAVHLFTQEVRDAKGRLTDPARHLATLHDLDTADCPKIGDLYSLTFGKSEKQVLIDAELPK